MRTIGVRELRQNAAEYLRLVEAGETVEITSHGRKVARLVPVREESHYERMVREGRIRPPLREWVDMEPLPADPSLPTLSEVLERMRADER
jgi:prevent-host-death family protein